MYPDPPTNDDALDIQQQALLREQQKKLKKLRKNAEGKDPDVTLHTNPPHQLF